MTNMHTLGEQEGVRSRLLLILKQKLHRIEVLIGEQHTLCQQGRTECEENKELKTKETYHDCIYYERGKGKDM